MFCARTQHVVVFPHAFLTAKHRGGDRARAAGCFYIGLSPELGTVGGGVVVVVLCEKVTQERFGAIDVGGDGGEVEEVARERSHGSRGHVCRAAIWSLLYSEEANAGGRGPPALYSKGNDQPPGTPPPLTSSGYVRSLALLAMRSAAPRWLAGGVGVQLGKWVVGPNWCRWLNRDRSMKGPRW